MKRDGALLFQSLLSLALIAFAGLVAYGLLTNARLSPETGELSEAAPNPIVADRAEWNQFYDAIVGAEREAEVAQPADAALEKRDVGDVVEVPLAPNLPENRPDANVRPTATAIAPEPAPSEQPAQTDTPLPQITALPDPPQEKSGNAATSNELKRDQEPEEATPAVAAAETAPPAVATAPAPLPDAAPEPSTPTPLPPARPESAPRPKVAAPAPPVPAATRVRQAAPQPEREPERSRPSTPARPRVALPRQRSAPPPERPQWNGSQWVDPQYAGPPQQSGALSYSPQEYAMPPGGPQFGPYFPFGSTPPTAQQRRALQSRSQPPSPRQPAPTYNDPFGWR